MESDDKFPDEIMSVLDSLEYITQRLRQYAQILLMTTLINLVFTMMVMSGMLHFLIRSVNISMLLVIFGIVAVMFAFRFDILKRDGDAYFEEISDELHGKKLREDQYIHENKISLKTRVIIRRYSNASSLPLIPGKYGPAIMAAINILFSFLGVI